MKAGRLKKISISVLITAVVVLLFFNLALATDVITNGTFDTNINGWDHSDNANGSVSWDDLVYGNAAGSIKNLSTTGRNLTYTSADSQYISTVINLADTVYLSLYWYKYSGVVEANRINILIDIIKPDNSTATIWSNTSVPTAGNFIEGTVADSNVSSFFDQTGNYYIKIAGDIKNGNDASAFAQFNLDDIILDVRTGSTNAPPTVVAGATQVSPDTVNRFGTDSTVISTDFNRL
jgi:hypothetical protein